MLLRHAKAAKVEGLNDFDRPLKPVGREQARRIGAFMAARALVPELAVVSTAVRARETFDLVDIFLHPPPARLDEPLMYEAISKSLFDILRSLPAKHASALFVGHNPGFEDFAGELVGGGEAEALARFGGEMATGALAVIDFPIDRWSAIEWQEGALALFVTPELTEVET